MTKLFAVTRSTWIYSLEHSHNLMVQPEMLKIPLHTEGHIANPFSRNPFNLWWICNWICGTYCMSEWLLFVQINVYSKTWWDCWLAIQGHKVIHLFICENVLTLSGCVFPCSNCKLDTCFQISQRTRQMFSLLMKLASRYLFWMCGSTFDQRFEEAATRSLGCRYIMMVQGCRDLELRKRFLLHLFFQSKPDTCNNLWHLLFTKVL